MPRGKRTCPECNSLCSVRSLSCSCGHKFEKRVRKKPVFFKERKEFIKRMLEGQKSIDYKLDMMVATKIFKEFKDNIDFLEKVKPPFKLEGSIKYFLGKEGMDYLRRKKLEFEYKPKNSEKMVDHKKKIGEDRLIEKRKTLRDFLDE